jgi:hypothetical protein
VGVWQAYVESLPTPEQRREALAAAPAAYQARIDRHVRTVFALRRYHARMAQKHRRSL